ncbi:hypothetical protein GCM10009706_14800 [Curtobacterium citreum]|nr:hypothetical protein GCM10009706_14800 [Curtobacterium citreum]
MIEARGSLCHELVELSHESIAIDACVEFNGTTPSSHTQEDPMAGTETHAEHTIAEHQHAADCGHEAVQHDDHVDYLHDGHKHAEHDGHYDEH